jgi:hypothetical protein
MGWAGCCVCVCVCVRGGVVWSDGRGMGTPALIHSGVGVLERPCATVVWPT